MFLYNFYCSHQRRYVITRNYVTSHDSLTWERDVKKSIYVWQVSGSFFWLNYCPLNWCFHSRFCLPGCFRGSTFNKRQHCFLSHLMRFHFKMSDILRETWFLINLTLFVSLLSSSLFPLYTGSITVKGESFDSSHVHAESGRALFASM